MSVTRELKDYKLVDGLIIRNPSNKIAFWEGCVMGKQHRLPFPAGGRTRATKRGQLFHSDLCGPMPNPSLNGSRYFLTLRDDFTGYGFIRFLKRKSEACQFLQELMQAVENHAGTPIAIFRSDNGGEFVNRELGLYMKTKGIKHQTSTPKTPEQNGVAERFNRTIMELARSMIHTHSVGVNLWAEASATAVYVLNRVTCKSSPNTTPYQGWHGVKPNVSHMRVSGCEAFMHVPKDERSKLEPKALKCRFVGYSETQKAYRLLDTTTQKIRISRDVIFNETISDDKVKQSEVTVFPVFSNSNDSEGNREGGDTLVSNGRATASSFDSHSHHMMEKEYEGEEITQPNTSPNPEENVQPFHGFEVEKCALRRSSRETRKQNHLIEDPNFLSHEQILISEPETYQDAVSSEESTEWLSAMREEFNSLKKNEVWRLKLLPEGRKAIKSKWVFKVKYYLNCHPCRFKARLVAKGFSQREGIDFDQTFAPVVRHESIRIGLSTAAANDLEIIQLDVRTAFGDLNE